MSLLLAVFCCRNRRLPIPSVWKREARERKMRQRHTVPAQAKVTLLANVQRLDKTAFQAVFLYPSKIRGKSIDVIDSSAEMLAIT